MLARRSRPCSRSVEAARKGGPLELFLEAGRAAKLERDTLVGRAAALFCGFAAGNLADNLADGDCTYLEIPHRTGPSVQYLLHNLLFAVAAQSGVHADALAKAGRTLAQGAGEEGIEVRTSEWREPLYRLVAEGIAGRQWVGYLEILWAGTPLDSRTETLGMAMGVGAHVTRDIESKDRRFWSMPAQERSSVAKWALEGLRRIEHEPLDFVARTLPPLIQVLEAHK